MTNQQSAHALLSPSGYYRWSVCARQPRFTAHMPNLSSMPAAEGTVAHTVRELALSNDKDAKHYIGNTFSSEVMGKPREFIVTKEMADAVQVDIDWTRNIKEADPTATVLLEKRVSLAALKPADRIDGTSDSIIYVPSLRRLIVEDYKHGAGKVVEVENNPQTKIYALGAWLTVARENDWQIDAVQTTIIQPRADHQHGPIRSYTYTPAELMDFAIDVLEAAERTQDPNAPFTPGDHCKWCPAENSCPGRFAAAQEVVPIQIMRGLPAATMLTLEQRGELLKRIEAIDLEGWIKSIRSGLHAELEGGASHPDWKLAPKRGTRQWAKPEAEVVAALRALVAVETDLYNMTLLSPAQAEKLVGKKKFPKELAVSVSSGFNLIPASDPRAGVEVDPGDEFDTITP